jgi:DNA-binding NarL/FixJ family response regulator
MPTISILVVEDDPSTRNAICAGIAAQAGMVIAASFGEISPAIAWLKKNTPDVLLVDLGLPDGSGLDVIAQCSALHPNCDIMVITMFGDERNVLAAVDAGALGYILKDTDELDVAQFVLDLRQGGSPMSPLVARKLLTRAPQANSSGRQIEEQDPTLANDTIGLTPTETKTLDLIARGYSYSEIAVLQTVSINTVQTHVKRIFCKLAVHSRGEAVFEAHKLGLLNAGLLSPD